ncbi:uncharacterized protein BXIN_0672 [Babesia sp. Xinjiang]|uniref:uncharacterized protein n=1 Tax=Babesia sp. Xinjiang TaxID=462227 RepID=UPI000A24FE22|nr:uncharacterized protein BXIN_0727 [Babesia sp. Xinjiang]XP_028872588.1 uncharacterized protein BXIN_0672 [Babesia sp. Xinjiang]ORM42095.1 hypothetical protein BXIN_0727 [Babesia sp. Xinjiang]ORM42132.1 hypothetical protein BXIN_0672 [Babesia sp. Xinjiang]
MDNNPSVADVSRSLDIVSGLLQSYEVIDEHIGRLRLPEASRLLCGCHDGTISLSPDDKLEDELRVCCASLRDKCLSEMINTLPVAFCDFLHEELERHRFQEQFMVCPSDPVESLDCQELFQRLSEDAEADDRSISDEADKVLHHLKWRYYHRYELLVKIVLFIGRQWLSLNNGYMPVAEQYLNLDGERLCISYVTFNDCLVILNLSGTFLRLIEDRASRYVTPTVHVSRGYDNGDISSVDYVHDHCLRLGSGKKVTAVVSIDGYDSTSAMISGVVSRISHVEAVLRQLRHFSDESSSGSVSSSIEVDRHLDYSSSKVTDFTCLSALQTRVLVDDLISRLIDSCYLCWDVECVGVDDLLRSFRYLCDTVIASEATVVDSSSRFVRHFFQSLLQRWEEHVLVYTRFCAQSQSYETDLNYIAASDFNIRRDSSIRIVDKRSIVTLLTSLLETDFPGISFSEVFTSFEWADRLESCGVCNDIYTLSILLFVLSAQPIALLRHAFDILGPRMVSHDVIALCIKRFSDMILSILATYMLVTQDFFKQFVLSITKTVSKDEDAKDLAGFNVPLTNFLLLLSNASLLSGSSLVLPYFVQSLESRISWGPAVECHGSVFSDLVKCNFHTCVAHVHMLKLQDYLITQLTALLQQVLQKLLSRVLNSLDSYADSFGEDAIQLLTHVSSLCDSILPLTLRLTTMCLLLDLYFTTLPDIILDYLDLLNYQPSDDVLGSITTFVVRLDGILSDFMSAMGKVNNDFVHHSKFVAFSAVFRHDFSCVDDPNSPYNQRDLNRLCKLCRCIQVRIGSV